MKAFAAVDEKAIWNGSNTILAKIQSEIVEPVVILLFAAALLLFLWGLVLYIARGSSEEQRSMGRKHMLYGSLGMGIMLSVQGIISFITATVGKL